KIDVEGAEEHVIRGAQSVLERHSPSLAIEVWFGTFTTNYARSLQLLNEFGYKTNAIREDGSLIPLEPADIPEYAKQVCADRRFAHALDNLIFTK
ncbi:MAG TPA: FkbM family methyltransferase, partial [Bryobacteraceae bacterium]|nr:FkbM family methyltransferase [Bryobacteraceae bacterium]